MSKKHFWLLTSLVICVAVGAAVVAIYLPARRTAAPAAPDTQALEDNLNQALQEASQIPQASAPANPVTENLPQANPAEQANPFRYQNPFSQ